MRYASGKDAWAICDRTGRRVRLRDLRTEWNGLRVHKNEWEPKHPQLRPRSVEDPEALRDARPGDSGVEHATAIIRRGVSAKARIGEQYLSFNASPAVAGTNLSSTTALGNESHWNYATPDGVSSTTAIGDPTIVQGPSVDGVSSTMALGTETPTASIAEDGFAITSALGNESIAVSATPDGVSTTVSLTNETPQAANIGTGVSATGAVGDVEINAWGSGTWGGRTWGQ